jgi:carbon monoxide dehydrogenase subunit G
LQVDYSETVKYSRETLWKALLDPKVLARLIPGIEKFDEVSPDKYAVTARLGLPSVRGVYSGIVEISEKNEPSSYRLRGDGKGTQGWAKGDVLITLTVAENDTKVNIKAHASVGGPIVGVGQRMMEGITKSMARDFFKALDSELNAAKAGNQ